MPISVQDIVDRLQSALDADGQGDYYLFDQDYKPAINYAIDFITGVINSRLSSDKLSTESLRELIRTRVYQTSKYSRVQFDSSDNVWSILAVYINPTVSKDDATPLPDVDSTPASSYLITHASHLTSTDSAKRLTIEQWNTNIGNPFLAGNTSVTAPFIKYGYLPFNDYSSTHEYAPTNEIEIRPELEGELVSIVILQYPTRVSLISDDIEFPESMTNIIVNLALRWLSFKQGDNTTINSQSNADIQALLETVL